MRRILARITFLYKVKFGVSAGIIWQQSYIHMFLLDNFLHLK